MKSPSGSSQSIVGISAILVCVVLLAVIFLAPYFWIAASSFKYQNTIFRDIYPLSLRTFIPEQPTFGNFVELFQNKSVARALANSALVVVLQVILTLVLCSMAAYALTRIRFRGAEIVFTLILLTALLPVEAMVVPLFRVVSGLGLHDTLIGVLIPWIASPFGLFLLRQAFEELPRELEEAAMLDGAGHVRIFTSIILPNVKTALVTLGLVTTLFSWNAFLWPLVVISSPSKQLIQVAVAQSVAPGVLPNWGETFAGATTATIPLILIFLLLQKYFIQGMTMTGVKG